MHFPCIFTKSGYYVIHAYLVIVTQCTRHPFIGEESRDDMEIYDYLWKLTPSIHFRWLSMPRNRVFVVSSSISLGKIPI